MIRQVGSGATVLELDGLRYERIAGGVQSGESQGSANSVRQSEPYNATKTPTAHGVCAQAVRAASQFTSGSQA